MEESTTTAPAPRTAAEYRAAIDDLLAGMKRMNEQMDRDREEIERLKAETEAIRAEAQVIKARLDRRLESLSQLL